MLEADLGIRPPLSSIDLSMKPPSKLLRIVDELKTLYEGHPTIRIGLAPHSVRAVDTEWLTACNQAATHWDMPIHIHVCEQPRELIECDAEHGCTPIELLATHHMLHERTTLVHATHLSDSDVNHISESQSIVCACPTTEANLGDGFLPSRALLAEGTRIALGTDSHAQIDLFQEARLVDMQARLLTQSRNPLAQFSPNNSSQLKTSHVFQPMMTTNGYASLGLNGGTLSPGTYADFIVLDRHHTSCLGTRTPDLLSSLILAGQPDMVKAVYVNGAPVVNEGYARAEGSTRQRYLQTFKEPLWRNLTTKHKNMIISWHRYECIQDKTVLIRSRNDVAHITHAPFYILASQSSVESLIRWCGSVQTSDKDHT